MDARVSQHAVERFQKRFASDLGFWAARRALKDAVARATPLRQRTRRGDEMLECDGARFVLKRDAWARKPIVVTVLYRGEDYEELDAA